MLSSFESTAFAQVNPTHHIRGTIEAVDGKNGVAPPSGAAIYLNEW